MPQLIVAVLVIWVAYLVLKYLVQVALIAVWPVLAGWLAYMAIRTAFRSSKVAEIESRLSELIELGSTTTRLEFRTRGALGQVVKPDDRETVVAILVSAATSAVVYYVLHFNGQFTKVTAGTDFPSGVTSFIGFVIAAAGLTGSIAFSRSKSSHGDFVQTVVNSRVRSLNAQATKAADFDAEATKNGFFRVSLGGKPEHARNALLLAIQDDMPNIIAGNVILQELLQQSTAQLRSENATLATLSQKKSSLDSTYDLACSEANRVGNEAIFRYLDLVAKGIASLRELIVQSKWTEFSQQIDGAQAELKRLIENIDQIGKTDADEAFEEEHQVAESHGDPYSTLGVRSDLSNEDLKSVYRSLAQIYHPDKGRVSDHRKFQEIQRAWQKICAEREI